ncbi:unnamed protein product [Rotaria sp. Silwood1]|nr:unnamed protein product [Rotaria sp. Silwood1]
MKHETILQMDDSQSDIAKSLDQLSKDKEKIDGKWFGFCSMQGYRPSMENFHQHLKHLDDHYLEFRRAIKNAFIKLDKNLRKNDYDNWGSVCIACLIGPKQIYLINVGDAQAIIISDNGEILASAHDHTLDDPNEEERIQEAGGKITRKSPKDILRVEQRLAMRRVLEDFTIDKNIVSPIPDIIIYSRKPSAAFIILASDGIWHVMSNEQAASFVIQRISTTDLHEMASQLLDHCLEKRSRDNMSVYIIQV